MRPSAVIFFGISASKQVYFGAQAFQPPHPVSSSTTVTLPDRSFHRRLSKLFESKDDEIAKLEEQLRKLKEEKEVEAETISYDSDIPVPDEDVPLEMFLTEQWKVQQKSSAVSSSAGDGEGGGLTTILYAVGAVALLLLFSQVPIGQEDLSKYSVGSSPSVEQIDLGDLNRARRSGDI